MQGNADVQAGFTYEHYREILKQACAFLSPRLVGDSGSLDLGRGGHLFLRHDIDCALEPALRMAQVEHEAGVCATYHIMMRSSLYQPDAVILRKIASLGHEIGVHFDAPDAYRTRSGHADALEALVIEDCRSLEACLGAPVRSISFHRPVEYLLRGALLVAGRVNAYAAELMEWYISDSRGQWRVGDPLIEVAQRRGNVLQILTHPIWWGASHMDAPDRLQAFFLASTGAMTDAEAEAFDQRLSATVPGVTRRKEL